MWEFWRSKLSKGKSRHRGGKVGSDGDDGDSPMSRQNTAPSPFGDSQLRRSSSLPTGPSEPPKRVSSLAPGPDNTTHVFFKDVIVPASDDEDDYDEESGLSNHSGQDLQAAAMRRMSSRRVDKQKLIIILVGLPARGKTFLCNKLMRYLNWLGHATRHFNVGHYRRRQRGDNELQDATFFDHTNAAGMQRREKALHAALDDMLSWLDTDEAQIAIFDATNSTDERRQFLRSVFHGTWQYLFLESICNDQEVLEQNYRAKLMYSADYKGFEPEAALVDFKLRIKKYEEVYETITDRSLHYIKLIDMVTGRGYMDVNRISGYISGKIVFFLMQVCKAGAAGMTRRRIWLTRHGQSEFNVLGKIGGDSGLSPAGQAYATILPEILVDRVPQNDDGLTYPVSVWTSTLKRTIQTAEHLPFPKLRWKLLDEIQAGIFDGMTYEEIAEKMPEEFEERRNNKLTYRYPSGESYMDVIQRLEAVIIEVERERECVCIVAHQAVLRALYAYFMHIPLKDVPQLRVPLHTLMELVPMPDGVMDCVEIPVQLPPTLQKLETQRKVDSYLTLTKLDGQHSPHAPITTPPPPKLATIKSGVPGADDSSTHLSTLSEDSAVAGGGLGTGTGTGTPVSEDKQVELNEASP